MKEKLIKELNELYIEYESILKMSIDYCGGKNKKSDYVRTTNDFSQAMVFKSNDYKMINDNEIEKLIQTLYLKLIKTYLVD